MTSEYQKIVIDKRYGKPGDNGFSKASMILGIVSLVFANLSFFAGKDDPEGNIGMFYMIIFIAVGAIVFGALGRMIAIRMNGMVAKAIIGLSMGVCSIMIIIYNLLTLESQGYISFDNLF